MLPAFQERFENVALVHLRVAHQGNHPPRGLLAVHQAVEAQVILHQRGEQGRRDPQPHRAGGKIHRASVLGTRGVGLSAAQPPESLEVVQALVAQQVLNGVEDRRGVGLDRDPVFRPQHVKVKRRHQGRGRGAGGLVAAHLEPVPAGPDVVGVVDQPGGEPQHALVQLLQHGQRVGRDGCRCGVRVTLQGTHGGAPSREWRSRAVLRLLTVSWGRIFILRFYPRFGMFSQYLLPFGQLNSGLCQFPRWTSLI